VKTCPKHPDVQRCWDSNCAEDATVWLEDPLAGCVGHLCQEHADEFTAGYNAIAQTSRDLEPMATD
jgi:hypothetical protein